MKHKTTNLSLSIPSFFALFFFSWSLKKFLLICFFSVLKCKYELFKVYFVCVLHSWYNYYVLFKRVLFLLIKILAHYVIYIIFVYNLKGLNIKFFIKLFIWKHHANFSWIFDSSKQITLLKTENLFLYQYCNFLS